MRMARVNVYLPDELAVQAREAGLNVSGLTQEALRRALDAKATDDWLDRVARLERSAIDRSALLEAVRAARDDMGSGSG